MEVRELYTGPRRAAGTGIVICVDAHVAVLAHVRGATDYILI